MIFENDWKQIFEERWELASWLSFDNVLEVGRNKLRVEFVWTYTINNKKINLIEKRKSINNEYEILDFKIVNCLDLTKNILKVLTSF